METGNINGPQAGHSVNRRHFRRARVLWNASLESGGRAGDCVLLNIGSNGAMVRTAKPWDSATPVMLCSSHFGGLNGRVIWRRGAEVGLQFQDHPVSVLDALLRGPDGLKWV